MKEYLLPRLRTNQYGSVVSGKSAEQINADEEYKKQQIENGELNTGYLPDTQEDPKSGFLDTISNFLALDGSGITPIEDNTGNIRNIDSLKNFKTKEGSKEHKSFVADNFDGGGLNFRNIKDYAPQENTEGYNGNPTGTKLALFKTDGYNADGEASSQYRMQVIYDNNVEKHTKENETLINLKHTPNANEIFKYFHTKGVKAGNVLVGSSKSSSNFGSLREIEPQYHDLDYNNKSRYMENVVLKLTQQKLLTKQNVNNSFLDNVVVGFDETLGTILPATANLVESLWKDEGEENPLSDWIAKGLRTEGTRRKDLAAYNIDDAGIRERKDEYNNRYDSEKGLFIYKGGKQLVTEYVFNADEWLPHVVPDLAVGIGATGIALVAGAPSAMAATISLGAGATYGMIELVSGVNQAVEQKEKNDVKVSSSQKGALYSAAVGLGAISVLPFAPLTTKFFGATLNKGAAQVVKEDLINSSIKTSGFKAMEDIFTTAQKNNVLQETLALATKPIKMVDKMTLGVVSVAGVGDLVTNFSEGLLLNLASKYKDGKSPDNETVASIFNKDFQGLMVDALSEGAIFASLTTLSNIPNAAGSLLQGYKNTINGNTVGPSALATFLGDVDDIKKHKDYAIFEDVMKNMSSPEHFEAFQKNVKINLETRINNFRDETGLIETLTANADNPAISKDMGTIKSALEDIIANKNSSKRMKAIAAKILTSPMIQNLQTTHDENVKNKEEIYSTDEAEAAYNIALDVVKNMLVDYASNSLNKIQSLQLADKYIKNTIANGEVDYTDLTKQVNTLMSQITKVFHNKDAFSKTKEGKTAVDGESPHFFNSLKLNKIALTRRFKKKIGSLNTSILNSLLEEIRSNKEYDPSLKSVLSNSIVNILAKRREQALLSATLVEARNSNDINQFVHPDVEQPLSFLNQITSNINRDELSTPLTSAKLNTKNVIFQIGRLLDRPALSKTEREMILGFLSKAKKEIEEVYGENKDNIAIQDFKEYGNLNSVLGGNLNETAKIDELIEVFSTVEDNTEPHISFAPGIVSKVSIVEAFTTHIKKNLINVKKGKVRRKGIKDLKSFTIYTNKNEAPISKVFNRSILPLFRQFMDKDNIESVKELSIEGKDHLNKLLEEQVPPEMLAKLKESGDKIGKVLNISKEKLKALNDLASNFIKKIKKSKEFKTKLKSALKVVEGKKSDLYDLLKPHLSKVKTPEIDIIFKKITALDTISIANIKDILTKAKVDTVTALKVVIRILKDIASKESYTSKVKGKVFTSLKNGMNIENIISLIGDLTPSTPKLNKLYKKYGKFYTKIKYIFNENFTSESDEHIDKFFKSISDAFPKKEILSLQKGTPLSKELKEKSEIIIKHFLAQNPEVKTIPDEAIPDKDSSIPEDIVNNLPSLESLQKIFPLIKKRINKVFKTDTIKDFMLFLESKNIDTSKLSTMLSETMESLLQDFKLSKAKYQNKATINNDDGSFTVVEENEDIDLEEYKEITEKDFENLSPEIKETLKNYKEALDACK